MSLTHLVIGFIHHHLQALRRGCCLIRGGSPTGPFRCDLLSTNTSTCCPVTRTCHTHSSSRVTDHTHRTRCPTLRRRGTLTDDQGRRGRSGRLRQDRNLGRGNRCLRGYEEKSRISNRSGKIKGGTLTHINCGSCMSIASHWPLNHRLLWQLGGTCGRYRGPCCRKERIL